MVLARGGLRGHRADRDRNDDRECGDGLETADVIDDKRGFIDREDGWIDTEQGDLAPGGTNLFIYVPTSATGDGFDAI